MIVEFVVAVIWGLIAGGIVNVMADELPLRRTLRLPRYVPDAKKRAIHIPYLDENGEDKTDEFVFSDDEKRPVIAWLGITAFLFGKRTSSDESVKLGWRYPLTELLSIFLMVITVAAIDYTNTANPQETIGVIQTIFWLIYMAIFTLIIVIDIEHKLILFVVIIPSSALAIIDALITSTPPSLSDALIGGLAGFLVFFLMYNGGFLFTYIVGALRGNPIKEVAFGYGDVMMATLSGLILGWRVLIFAMFITVFLGAFGAIIYLLGRSISGGRYSAFTAIPYGPYIVAGTILMLLFRDTLGPAMFGAVFPP
jgi:leader peptidase (prepilin peptidase) / N-methyltransferase